MSRYEYPGYPSYVDAAIAALGLADLAALARHMPALRAMDSLVVQMIATDPARRDGVLQYVRAQRDALVAAAEAARLLYDDVVRGLALEPGQAAAAASPTAAPASLASTSRPAGSPHGKRQRGR